MTHEQLILTVYNVFSRFNRATERLLSAGAHSRLHHSDWDSFYIKHTSHSSDSRLSSHPWVHVLSFGVYQKMVHVSCSSSLHPLTVLSPASCKARSAVIGQRSQAWAGGPDRTQCLDQFTVFYIWAIEWKNLEHFTEIKNKQTQTTVQTFYSNRLESLMSMSDCRFVKSFNVPLK